MATALGTEKGFFENRIPEGRNTVLGSRPDVYTFHFLFAQEIFVQCIDFSNNTNIDV